jgi:hypothetical protein
MLCVRRSPAQAAFGCPIGKSARGLTDGWQAITI